ncbi:hypothetical protein K491DRAFT_317629 [Lophiostoma macrostomum CBS 122681]|uniref:Uncharacterized protein n=1 Tax=Lophiostoma macrostomum CBS 122681 TaxID=1314788 RepID=A0A6A6SI67_9PLEO|nr:hypothetical protein K491DRAFT_317629 [Lophiostoma macrostomum CBS 122681]
MVAVNMKFHEVQREPSNRSRYSLLRVCRQIYAETALLPYNLNWFFAETIRDSLSILSNAYIQNRIRSIAIVLVDACRTLDGDGIQGVLWWLCKWPSLRRFHIFILPDPTRSPLVCCALYGGMDGFRQKVLRPQMERIRKVFADGVSKRIKQGAPSQLNSATHV